MCNAQVAGYPTLHAVTAHALELHGVCLPPLKKLRAFPGNLWMTANWLGSIESHHDRGSESAQCLRPVDSCLLFRREGHPRRVPCGNPGHPFDFDREPGSAIHESVVLLSGLEASRLVPLLRKGLCPAPHKASEQSVQLCHLRDPGMEMVVCPWGQPKRVNFHFRALLKFLNGDSRYWPEEQAELAKFLGILEPTALLDCVDACGSLSESKGVWDILRDKQVLALNGFVKRLTRRGDVEDGVLPPSSELQLHHLLKRFFVRSGELNPKTAVEELVKLRLQMDCYRGSSLEDLISS
ncbi:unnamed protein product [Symbiodinium natans]|uniref:Uncharacterized protein n=1 Tax=Symbiodinium natans TaxID=878477 RepID=A0A812HIQ5_9DINO|nr:unnamed protein product [Symbiodinium natans]